MFKKGVLFFLCLYLLACGFTDRQERHRKEQMEESFKQEQAAFKTTRDIPDTIDLGAYLSGLIAKESKDWDKAADYFERALAKDEQNIGLQENLYLLRLASGEVDKALPMALSFKKDGRTDLMAQYVVWSNWMKQQKYQTVVKDVKLKSTNELDDFLTPLFKAWGYAGLGNKKAALQALSPLKNKKDTASFYWYQSALLGLYLKQPDMIDSGFKNLHQAGVPTISAWGVIKPYYERLGQWTSLNPLYDDYQHLLKTQYVLAMALPQLQADSIQSPESGLAEGLYNLSTLVQSSDKNVTLVLNALASYLDGQHLLSRLLNAEIFEEMAVYQQANKLYEQMPQNLRVIKIKKAFNYIRSENQEMALKTLQGLSVEKPTDSRIYKLLGDIYQNKGLFEQAISCYSKALGTASVSMTPAEVAAVYMGRGINYEQIGQLPASEQDFQRALALTPHSAVLLNEIAYRWLEADKNILQAFEMIQKALLRSPNSPQIMDSLAFGYYKLNQFDKALPLAEASADKIPYSSVVNMHLGDIYQALGRYREAVYQYRKALDLKSDITPKQVESIQKKIDLLAQK